MKTMLITAGLTALIGTAFALKAPHVNVTIQDEGFTYYSSDDRDKIDRRDLERISYLRLWITDEGLTVRLADDPFEGAIAHTFKEIPELDRTSERQIWGERRNGESWLEQKELQADERERLREMVGIDELGLGWAIRHGDAVLGEVVDTYLGWFDDENLDVQALRTGLNSRSYQVSNDSASMRVTFTTRGNDVRVYIQE